MILSEYSNIGVLGGGSWGTALSQLLSLKGYKIDLWVYESDVCNVINEKHKNDVYLPGMELSNTITATNCLEEACSGKQMIVVVTPSHALREVVSKAAPYIQDGAIIISATKGIEEGTLLSMSQVIESIFTRKKEVKVTVLSGPSFAREVVKKIPTAVTVASSDVTVGKIVQEIFSVPYFRVYTNVDVIGVELCGALKNVMAIATGIVDGLNFGYNTRALIITRGLAEMTRLGIKMGADPLTFSGLAGVGDLVLTCTGELSRNRTFGMKLCSCMNVEKTLREMKMVVEGFYTSKSAYLLSKRLSMHMPITEQIYLVLYENKLPYEGFQHLLLRT